jgi:hypothetical protein
VSALDRDSLDRARKEWSTLVATFALSGFELHRRAGGGFLIASHGGSWSKEAGDLADVIRFAECARMHLPLILRGERARRHDDD